MEELFGCLSWPELIVLAFTYSAAGGSLSCISYSLHSLPSSFFANSVHVIYVASSDNRHQACLSPSGTVERLQHLFHHIFTTMIQKHTFRVSCLTPCDAGWNCSACPPCRDLLKNERWKPHSGEMFLSEKRRNKVT